MAQPGGGEETQREEVERQRQSETESEKRNISRETKKQGGGHIPRPHGALSLVPTHP